MSVFFRLLVLYTDCPTADKLKKDATSLVQTLNLAAGDPGIEFVGSGESAAELQTVVGPFAQTASFQEVSTWKRLLAFSKKGSKKTDQVCSSRSRA